MTASLPSRVLLLGAVAAVASALLAACGGGGEEQRQITHFGDPATRDWPAELTCPVSLESLCGGASLELASTLNFPKRTVVRLNNTGPTPVVCRWPPTDPDSCSRVGPNGAPVKGEAAVYLFRTG